MSFSAVIAWTPDFQIFKNWIWDREEIIRMWQELASWIFYFWISGLLSLLWGKKTMAEQALPPALLLGIRRPEFSPDPRCKLWHHSVQSELRPVPPGCQVFTWTFWLRSLCCSISLHLVPGFFPMVIHTTLLLKKTPFQWTTVTQEASSESSWCGLHLHSCVVLPRFSIALFSDFKLLKPNSWSYSITTKAQFVPWVCISFLQLKPSETRNKFGPGNF